MIRCVHLRVELHSSSLTGCQTTRSLRKLQDIDAFGDQTAGTFTLGGTTAVFGGINNGTNATVIDGGSDASQGVGVDASSSAGEQGDALDTTAGGSVTASSTANAVSTEGANLIVALSGAFSDQSGFANASVFGGFQLEPIEETTTKGTKGTKGTGLDPDSPTALLSADSDTAVNTGASAVGVAGGSTFFLGEGDGMAMASGSTEGGDAFDAEAEAGVSDAGVESNAIAGSFVEGSNMLSVQSEDDAVKLVGGVGAAGNFAIANSGASNFLNITDLPVGP